MGAQINTDGDWLSHAERRGIAPDMAGKMQALENYAIGRTLPLVARPPGRQVVNGTATALDVGGRLHLVTAAHVPEEFAQAGLPMFVPAAQGGAPPLDLGRHRVVTAPVAGVDLDVAVIVLEDEEVATQLRAHWGVITPDDLAPVRPEVGFFYIAGYPYIYGEQSGADFRTGMAVVVSSRYEPGGAYPSATDPAWHLLLNHHEVGRLGDGTSAPSFNLKGVSGATVWALDLDAQGLAGAALWDARGALRAVAVQVAYAPGRYIKATRWEAVANALRKVDAVAYDEVASRLGL